MVNNIFMFYPLTQKWNVQSQTLGFIFKKNNSIFGIRSRDMRVARNVPGITFTTVYRTIAFTITIITYDKSDKINVQFSSSESESSLIITLLGFLAWKPSCWLISRI